MLEKLIAAIAFALLDWLAKRLGRPIEAKDADTRIDLLRSIGQRVREWESRSGVGVKPDEGGSEHKE